MKRSYLFCSTLVASAVIATPALAEPDFWSDLKPGVVAYDPFIVTDEGARGDGEYSASSDVRTQGAAAFGWEGSAGVDGFGVPHSGSTSNFVPNAIGNDAAAVDYEQDGRLQWLGVGNFPFDRNLTRQLNPTVTSDTWYQSMILNRTSWEALNAPDSTYVVGGFTDSGGNGLQIGYDDTAGDGNPDLVIRLDGVNQVLLADTASSVTQFVVTRLTIDESGDDTIDVLVNPASLASEPASYDLSFTAEIADNLSPFTQSKYESPGQSGVLFWDEVLLTTDFDSISNPIIPEPTSLALFAASFLLMLRRRRS
jgi:hypothetical protein